jgi:hypothetical protein
MAVTATGEALTEAHRQAQIRLRAVVAADVARAWRLFDLGDIGASWARIEPVLLAVIVARHRVSVGLTARYLDLFRSAEDVPGVGQVVAGPTPTRGQMVGNLRTLGPAAARRMVGRADAAEVLLSTIEGEVSRQVLAGGRDTLVGSVTADRRALGYTRVTDGAPCAFCAMLAGRGPVYDAATVGFQAHRKCGCTGEPVYRDDQPWPRSAERWRDLYDQVAASRPPDSQALRAEFRRRYDALR